MSSRKQQLPGDMFTDKETKLLLKLVKKYATMGQGRVKAWQLIANDINDQYHEGKEVRTRTSVSHRFYRLAYEKKIKPSEYLRMLAGTEAERMVSNENYEYVRQNWLFKTLSQMEEETGLAGRVIEDMITELKKASLLPDKHKKTVLKEIAEDSQRMIQVSTDDDLGKKVLVYLRSAPHSITQLSTKIDRSEATVKKILEALKDDNYEVAYSKESDQVVLDRHLEPKHLEPLDISKFYKKHMTIGLVSDTHFGSKHQQLTLLHSAYEQMEKEGVQFVLHAGDITDGYKLYGEQHIRELFITDADQQRDYAIEHYPRRDGIKTYLIGGNHDGSFTKHAGYNIVKGICKERDDIEYRGMLGTTFELDDIWFNMLHPSGGVPYARSYRPQKLAENVMMHAIEVARTSKDIKKLPSLLAIGHYHVEVNFDYMGMRVISVPCFQSQTGYLKAKGLNPTVGFIILNLYFDDEHNITRAVPDLRIMNSKVIENDW